MTQPITLRRRTPEEQDEYLRIRRLPFETRMKMAHNTLQNIYQFLRDQKELDEEQIDFLRAMICEALK